MIEDLYKTLIDCKYFFESSENHLGKLAICVSYEQLMFVYNLVELTIMIAKLSGGQHQ